MANISNLTILVPFWQGHSSIHRLLDSLPDGIPVIIVDDHSDKPLGQTDGARVVWNRVKGYFAGAVNTGIGLCDTDVLVLNQDVRFTSDRWLLRLNELRKDYAVVGDGVTGHPAWPRGYVQGTFFFLRRDAIDDVGLLEAEEYPLWGCTCEWQLRACRKGYKAHVGQEWRRWMDHEGRHEDGQEKHRPPQFGKAIVEALRREPEKRKQFIRTPPAVSVIVPCHNYGRYLEDAVNSLMGGPTSIGEMEPQTFQSFEVVIVDDASTDDSWQTARSLADPWKAVKAVRLPENVGTPGALNAGVRASHGEYVTVLSADDMLEPWGLEVLYQACRKDPKTVTYGDIRIVKDGERSRVLRLPEYDFDRVLNKNPMSAGIMYHRSGWNAAGGYPEEMVYGREDWAFNIALGLKGYCGEHVGMSGYLYRREGQNRSLRTGNRHKGETASGFSWCKTFEQQIRALFPSAFGERPMGCCGGRATRPASNPSNLSNPEGAGMQALPGQDGMVLLEYVGGSHAKQTWWGESTNLRYVFSLGKPQGYVDARDADELLSKRHNHKMLFRAVVAPPPQPKVPVEKQIEANPPPEAELVPEPELAQESELVQEPTSVSEPEPLVTYSITAKAQEMAEDLGVDWTQIAGTGFGNRITVKDVRAAA